MVEIVEVKTKRQFKKFATFPIKLYKNCPYYVPSFVTDEKNIADKKRNLSLGTSDVKCFLAYKDGKLAGRVAGIIVNKFNDENNLKCIRFSRLDFINDEEVAKALLDAVVAYGKERGMDTLHGPWGFNDTDKEGLLTMGFDEYSTYATNYSYDYYHKIIEKFGFDKESEWVEQRLFVPEKMDERVEKVALGVQRMFKIRDVAEDAPLKKIIEKYGDQFFEVYEQAYSKLDGFVSFSSQEEKQAVLKQFATVINPRYLSMLVDKDDNLVAFGVLLPMIGKIIKKSKGKLTPVCMLRVLKEIKKPTGLELTLVGVKPEYQKLGLTSLAIHKAMKNAMEDGITDVVVNPMLTTNTAVITQWKTIESDIIKRRQTYKKVI